MSSTIKSIYFLIFEIFIEKIFIDKTKFYVTDELTDEITFIQTIRRWIQFRNRSVLVHRIYKCLDGFSNWCRFIDSLRLSAEVNTPMRGRYWGHENLERIGKVTLVPLNFFSSISISCFDGSNTFWVGVLITTHWKPIFASQNFVAAIPDGISVIVTEMLSA